MSTIVAVGSRVHCRRATRSAPEPEPEDMPSNYERIAALDGAYAIHVNSQDSQSDLFEDSSDEGELIAATPEGMFTDTSIIWFERVTGRANGLDATDDNGDDYTQVVVVVQRGDSTAHFRRTLRRLPDDWAWILINEDTQEWIMWGGPAAGTNNQVGTTVFLVPTYITEASAGTGTVVQAIAQSFSDGETLTAGRTFQNALQDSELVLALIPDTFRPTFA